MSRQNKPYFPLFVDISNKKIIVVGGGKIAQRRIETLLDFTNNLWVIAPEVTNAISLLNKNQQIHWIKDIYHSYMIADADIVLAATNDDLCNDMIAKDCKSRHILVNTAHKKESCDFYFPGIVKHKNIVTGITASGSNHHEAKKAREQISQALKEK